YTDSLNESEWQYLGSEIYDNDSQYSHLWQIGSLQDGDYYKIRVIAWDIAGLSTEKKSGVFAINNIDRKPDWEEFKYNVSTNLSIMSKWWNVSNLRLGNSYGMINFSGRTLNVDGLNLSLHINISRKKISLDDTNLPCMNGSAYLHFFNAHLLSPRIYRNGAACPPAICQLISNDNTDVVVRVSQFSTYEVIENAYLSIWDITDSNRYPGNQSRYRDQTVEFYANLTAGTAPINNSFIKCFIRFNTSEYGPFEMLFNSSNLYEYRRNFLAPAVYPWNVSCNSTEDIYFEKFAKDNTTILNRAPRLKSNLPNITMEEDTTVLYISNLYDYFEDPDRDLLGFNITHVPNVNLRISANRIIITPEADWFGNRTFIVRATDEFMLSNTSNIVRLTVVDVPEPPEEEQTSGGGGGGGGGGGSAAEGYDEHWDLYQESPDCRDVWICTGWGRCEYRWARNLSSDGSARMSESEGIMTRRCSDKNTCNYWWKKPNEIMYCVYIPTCNDLIRNQNETGVDCGGPCKSCFSCSDGIKNQGEVDVDCGGPCPACGNCNDGTKNCHDGGCEMGTDCGGPCERVCPEEEEPSIVKYSILPLIMLLMIVSLFTTYLFMQPYGVRFYLFLMALKNRKKEVPKTTLAEIELRYLAQLEKLRKRAEREEPAKIASEVNALFKRFMMEAFEVKQEITYEELIELMRKEKMPALVRVTLEQHVLEIIKEEYSSAEISRGRVISKIDRTRELFDLMVREIKPRETETAMAGKKQKPGKAKESPRKTIIKIYKLCVEAKRALLKRDADAAAKLEAELVSAYNSLPAEQRRGVEERVAQTLEEIRKAREKRGEKD
ncbi:MAG: hypothetical protein WC749_16820, partial [Dehalococcoidia bacterium]